MNNEQLKNNSKNSFHVNPYCFDSTPEKQLFLDLMKDKKVKKVYFTGMLTHGQSEFYVQYVDPETFSVRSYYPDFLVQKKDDTWIIIEVKRDDQIDEPVVKAKAYYANQLASENQMTYKIIKGTDAGASQYSSVFN